MKCWYWRQGYEFATPSSSYAAEETDWFVGVQNRGPLPRSRI